MSKTHLVHVDTEKCSLCEVCARRCPTDALTTKQEGTTLSLFYQHGECIGCPVGKSCEDTCPEKALRLERDADAAGVPAVELKSQGELVQCSYCKDYFAPLQRLDKVSGKGEDVQPDRVRCPLCRRTNLVVTLIEEKRMRTGNAKYRSFRDILRKTGHKKMTHSGLTPSMMRRDPAEKPAAD